MKRTFAVLVAFLFLIGTLFGASPSAMRAPQGFEGELWNSTLALYGTLGDTTHFLCTAEVIESSHSRSDKLNHYRILSAGHCVQLAPEGLQFSVSETIGGPRTNVTLVKAVMETDVDMAIFDFASTKQYPVMQFDTEAVQVGDKTVDINFAAGVGKQMSRGTVSSGPLPLSAACDEDCAGDFLTQMFAAGGASGSAIVSARTHKIIGLAIWMDPSGNIGVGTEPISTFAKFMAMPNQPHAAPETDDDN